VGEFRRGLGILLIIACCTIPTLGVAGAPASRARPRVAARFPGPTLRLAMPDSSPTIDPALVADEQNVQLANMLYGGLVKLDASYHIVLDAAAKYTLSSNRRVFTFFLRKGLKFSNGDPLTARDFAFSIQRSLNPALRSPSAPTYLMDIQGAYRYVQGRTKQVSGIRVVNADTLRITTRWPAPYFLTELTYPTSFALDSKRISSAGTLDNVSWYSHPISSGPYRVSTWVPNAALVLNPNLHYWGPRPELGHIRIALGPLPSSKLYPFLSHALDVTTISTYRPALDGRPGINEAPVLGINGVYMNVRAKPFQSVHVRRALTLALNRSRLVRAAMGSDAIACSDYVPPGEPAYGPHGALLNFNPVRARSEIAAAGFVDGKKFPRLTLYYPDDPLVGRLTRSMAKQWYEILGIHVSVRALTLNTLLTKVQSGSVPFYLLGWNAEYPDLRDALSLRWETGSPNNYVHFRSAAFDRLARSADATWNPARRMRLYSAAESVLASDAAWIPLYVPNRMVFIRPNVTNLKLTGYGLIPQAADWSHVSFRGITVHERRGE
jgi:oligopeptide transport system substrate-binding protein